MDNSWWFQVDAIPGWVFVRPRREPKYRPTREPKYRNIPKLPLLLWEDVPNEYRQSTFCNSVTPEHRCVAACRNTYGKEAKKYPQCMGVAHVDGLCGIHLKVRRYAGTTSFENVLKNFHHHNRQRATTDG